MPFARSFCGSAAVTIDSSPTDPATTAGDPPIYRQIYWQVRNGIESGTLKPGDRVPSVRALAKELGIARGTVETAYAVLNGEGWIQSRGQAGTVVTPGLATRRQAGPRPAGPREAEPAPGCPAPGSDAALESDLPMWPRPKTPMPLQMGLPALDAVPRKLWARLGARCLRGMRLHDLSYPATAGLDALRETTAAYLQVSRGLHCTPSQVFITSGYHQSMQVATSAVLSPQDAVWVEDPGYPPTRALLAQFGMDWRAVPVDEQGLDVAAGQVLAPQARAAVVTPAHQSPLSLTLSPARRQALLAWAAEGERWIVEDDYDGEYRYVSRPLPALASRDTAGRVLYAGTFSKVLFPGLRLSYLVVPPALVPRVERVHALLGAGAPWLTQATLALFMSEGHFARHIQRMRRLYTQRRSDMAAALDAALGPGLGLRVEPQPGGMHMVLRLPAGYDDRALALRLREAGLYAQPLSSWSSLPGAPLGLLMSFTNVADREQADALAARMRLLLRPEVV
ncbi:DNA-binding protein [Bordetella genomosp. 5]|nr:DNA-binding protein [Bordetella genomosp. 5]